MPNHRRFHGCGWLPDCLAPRVLATDRGDGAQGSADFSPHAVFNALLYKTMRTEVRAPTPPPADGAQVDDLVSALTMMYETCILVCMRTTINIDDSLLEKARRLTGIDEKTALVRQGLEALIALESARRLARLGGTEPELETPRRRRPAP